MHFLRKLIRLARIRENLLRRIGWAYIIYHSTLACAFLATMPSGISRQKMEILELAFIFFIYPALIPAVFVCGGLHARNCDGTLLGVMVLATFFLVGAAWYLIGSLTFASFVIRIIRRRGRVKDNIV
mgnify:CR=1 FL=1